jgi:UDP-glucose 4-epimerase
VASSPALKLTLHRTPDSITPDDWEMGELMTVLVTGGAGYIGSHMVLALAEAGESVVVIDNLSTGFSAFLPEGVPLFIGDAADENLVEGVIAAHGVESIVHFAGSVVAPDSMRDPLAYYRDNTMTTRSLLNAAVKCGVNSFIFSSTARCMAIRIRCPFPKMHRRGRRLTAPRS